MDFISPFDGYTYYLRIIDRITTWTKVIPTTDVTAETACKVLIHNWITRFGCPVTITTDRGKNFESYLFKHLTDMLGTNCIWATSYYPQSNGLVERFHRHLKSSITAHSQSKWTEVFSKVLGICTESDRIRTWNSICCSWNPKQVILYC